MKTVRLSNLPSPSVSSKIRMRSPFAVGFVGPGTASDTVVRLGDPDAAAIVDGRTRSAGARRVRRRTSVTLKPSGTVIAAAACSGGKPAYLNSSGMSDRAASRSAARRHVRLIGVKAEVVEVDVAPVARLPIDEANENLFAHLIAEIDRDAAQVLLLRCRRVREKTLPVSLRTSSTQVFSYGPPPTRKLPSGCVTLNGALVSVPCGFVALPLAAADPVLP